MRMILFEKEKKKFSKKDLVNSFVKILSLPDAEINIEKEDELAEGYAGVSYEHNGYKPAMYIINTNVMGGRNQGEVLDEGVENMEIVDGRAVVGDRTVPITPKLYKFKIIIGSWEYPNNSSDITIEEFVKLKLMAKEKRDAIITLHHENEKLKEEEFLRYTQTL